MRDLVALALVILALIFGAGVVVGGAVLLLEDTDPFAQLGEPVELWAHDQVVFGDGQVLSVEDIFAGVDRMDWPSFAKDVLEAGGRFERVECEVWEEGRKQFSRCVPKPLAWTDVIAHDFAMEA